MKNIRYTPGILLILLITGFVSEGCQSGKKVIDTAKPEVMNETQQREYNYALTEATKQKLFGNFKQAAALYMKCIQVNPRSDAAYFQLSGIYMIGRDPNTAKALNLKAVSLDPDNYWYKIQLAQLYMMTEAQDSAIAVYEDIVSRWPEKLEVKYELSRLYSETGKSAEALKMLNAIEAENGISEPVTMLKEQIHVKEKKYDQAIHEMKAIIKAAPEEIKYLGILADLYNSIDRKEEAKACYKKIFEIEPDNGLAQLSMADFYRLENNPAKQFGYLTLAFRNRSMSLDPKMNVILEYLTDEEEFRENTERVDSLIQILMELYPDDYRVKTARANYLSKVERYEEAIKVYDDILSEQKGNYFVWEQTIFIENILGNTDQVYKRCNEALKYFQDKPFLYLFLGNSAMQKGKNGEAVKALDSGLEYVKNNIPLTVQFYAFLAEAYRNMGQDAKSDSYFEKALQMEPDNIMILNNYGYYLALRGEKLEKAEKMSKKTIIVEPENPTYLDTYAWILYKSGKLSEARDYMQKAIDNGGGEDPDILEHYGDILEKIGNHEEALKYWLKAKDNGAESAELDKKIRE